MNKYYRRMWQIVKFLCLMMKKPVAFLRQTRWYAECVYGIISKGANNRFCYLIIQICSYIMNIT